MPNKQSPGPHHRGVERVKAGRAGTRKASAAVRIAGSRRTGPLVGIIMGSKSDWETMSHASAMLRTCEVSHEVRVVSAHRTPDWLFRYARDAENRGIEVIIAGAGGAAHLPGMCAALTTLPVLGVPVESRALKGLDSLLSIVQMPAGIPVGTLAIGKAGAANAALLAAAILRFRHPAILAALRRFRAAQTAKVMRRRDPRKSDGPEGRPQVSLGIKRGKVRR